MRKTSVWVLCGLMGLTTAAFAAAQTEGGAMGTESGTSGSMSSGTSGTMSHDSSTAKKSTTKHHKAKAAAKSHSATGDVTVADSAAKTFSVKGKGKAADKNFIWNDTTKFSPAGKTGADIAVGSNVTVWYNPTLTVVPMPATKVRFNTPKAAPAAAKTPSK